MRYRLNIVTFGKAAYVQGQHNVQLLHIPRHNISVMQNSYAIEMAYMIDGATIQLSHCGVIQYISISGKVDCGVDITVELSLHSSSLITS